MEQCGNCRREIGDLEAAHVYQDQVVCAACRARLPDPVLAYAAPAVDPASAPCATKNVAHATRDVAYAAGVDGRPLCVGCGTAMEKAKRSYGNCGGLAAALLVFVAGLILFVLIPVLGWLVGGLMMLFSLGMGGTREKIWKCPRCSSWVPRL